MKSLKKMFLIVILIVIVILVLFKFIGPLPCFSQEFVENYVSKYSKDFFLVKKESYSLGLNSFKESDETDWYFHDNELDFGFHVKTLKSEYPPKGKHIACNYYDAYIEKFLNAKDTEIKQMITDMFSEIYDIEEYDIYYYHDTGQIRISIDGRKNTNFSKDKSNKLCQTASIQLCEYIEKYDLNFKNRNKNIGWDVDLNTDWSDPDEDLSIYIKGEIFSVKDYYNNK